MLPLPQGTQHRFWTVVTVAASLIAALLIFTHTIPVLAASFVVDSAADTGDFANDGVCDINDSSGNPGDCTLRAALEQANNLAGNDAISFDVAITAINIATELALSSDVTLTGAGVTVDNTGTGRVLNVTGGVSTITGLTITGGSETLGGGISVSGTGVSLTLDGARVTNNRAGTYGGGIYVASGAAVILNNATQVDANGGISTAIRGGGIAVEDASLTVQSGSDVRDNLTNVFAGGGIHANGSTTTLLVTGSGTTVSGNRVTTNAFGSGGCGIDLRGSATGTIDDNAEISNNGSTVVAGVNGGGIRVAVGFLTVQGGADVINNTVGISFGGGIYASGTPGSVTVTGSGTTVSGNRLAAGGSGGGISANNFPSILIDNNAEISNNGGNTTAISGGGISAENIPSFTIQGGADILNNITNIQFGGGVNLTGNTALTVNGSGTTISGNRVSGAAGGIRATTGTSVILENNALVTDNGGSSGGINGGGAMITQANLTVRSGADITNNVTNIARGGGVYILGNSTDPTMSGSTLITGSGTTVTGNRTNTTDTFSGGGGIYVVVAADLTIEQGAEVTNNGGVSGGIHGGGIYVGNNTTVDILTGASVSENTVNIANGGAIYINPLTLASTVTLNGAIIRENSVSTSGGAIFLANNLSNLSVTGTQIVGNTAANGSAIFQTSGTVSITSSCVVCNADHAIDYAGGTLPMVLSGNWWGSANGPYYATATNGLQCSLGDSLDSANPLANYGISVTTPGSPTCPSPLPTGNWLTSPTAGCTGNEIVIVSSIGRTRVCSF